MQLAQYIRMSTALQTDSPETQKSIIKEFCNKNGHVIVRSYEDEAISGGSMEKRGALIEMIMDAEKRLFEGIVIYKYDRAFRNLAEQVAVFSKLRKYNIKVIAAADPNSDGASGELIVNILGAVNQFERQLTGERIYDKNRELKKQGRWTGSGIDPFGYRYDKETKQLLIVEGEAEVVRFAFNKYLELRTIKNAVEALQESGHKTKTGKEWTNERVHTLLINPLYAGKQRWGYITGKIKRNRNCEVFPGQHEAIISPEVFERVQEVLRGNRLHKSFTKGHRTYLLGGLLRCSICGGIAIANFATHRKKAVYRCKDQYNVGKSYCQGWSKMAYMIEDAVYRALMKNIKRLDLYNLKKKDNTPSPDYKNQIEKKLKKIEDKLLRQVEMYEEGDIDKETYKTRRTKTLREKEELEKELLHHEESATAANEGMIDMMGNFEDIWDEVDDRTRKDMLRTIIHIIHSDGQSVKIEFKNLGLPGWRLEAEVPLK